MDPAEVKWTAREYSLQEYVNNFQDSFPNIIKITEGFLGKQEIDSVSSSTVIRVNSLYNQQRVTAETKSGKLFSLPTKLTTLKFLVAQDKKPVKYPQIQLPMHLEGILSRYNLPVTIQSAKALSYKQKGDMTSQDEMLSELTLQETYEEPFLLGHPIDKGKIFTKEPTTIPMYMMELKLVVATGLLQENPERWNEICDLMTKQVEDQGSFANITLDEIFMLDKKNVSTQKPMYNVIEPIYIDLSEVNSCKNQPLEKCNMYEMQPILDSKQTRMNHMTQPQAKTETLKSKIFATISDIPSDLHTLTVQQVCECLKCLNMSQYVEAFQTEQVDGELVYGLNPEMMKNYLGMNELHVVKLLKFRDGWRPNLEG
ncbi:uncharacterized protein LOC134932271 [Pseudophryne corroboree]|uniref:uncharacterized protein LOC134932271 n=1 Tax=Pseudophryne corroboree TaxID=495146 RepID=UPI0030812B62